MCLLADRAEVSHAEGLTEPKSGPGLCSVGQISGPTPAHAAGQPPPHLQSSGGGSKSENDSMLTFMVHIWSFTQNVNKNVMAHSRRKQEM